MYTEISSLCSISVPDTVFKYTAAFVLYLLNKHLVNDFVDVYFVALCTEIERIVYHILSLYLKISEFHPHYIFFVFSSGSTTSIELTFYSVLYAFAYFPSSLEGLKQGIRIKGREMKLVWHEKASRTALQTCTVYTYRFVIAFAYTHCFGRHAYMTFPPLGSRDTKYGKPKSTQD